MGRERGPLIDFEVTWRSGHVETVRAHQCILPQRRFFGAEGDEDRRITFHGEFDGHWQLVLAADEADVLTVRNVTVTEARP